MELRNMGLTYSEIGAQLNLSPSSIKYYYDRREELKDGLGEGKILTYKKAVHDLAPYTDTSVTGCAELMACLLEHINEEGMLSMSKHMIADTYGISYVVVKHIFSILCTDHDDKPPFLTKIRNGVYIVNSNITHSIDEIEKVKESEIPELELLSAEKDEEEYDTFSMNEIIMVDSEKEIEVPEDTRLLPVLAMGVQDVDTEESNQTENTNDRKNQFLTEEIRDMIRLIGTEGTHYLIDTENISSSAIEDMVKSILPGNILHFFYSIHSHKISFDSIQNMMEKYDQLNFIPCFCGEKNALDFQIVSVLGMFILKGGIKNRFILVTNDKGFDVTVDFWKKRGVMIERCGENNLSDINYDNNKTGGLFPGGLDYYNSTEFAKYLVGMSTREREDAFDKVIKCMKLRPATSEQKQNVKTLVLSKGFSGYDLNVLAQIFSGDPTMYTQSLMIHAFGQEKSDEFYRNTTISERKALRFL